MQRWEYLTVWLSSNGTADREGVSLSDYGWQGWSLVQIVSVAGQFQAIFQRPAASAGPAQRIETKGS